MDDDADDENDDDDDDDASADDDDADGDVKRDHISINKIKTTYTTNNNMHINNEESTDTYLTSDKYSGQTVNNNSDNKENDVIPDEVSTTKDNPDKPGDNRQPIQDYPKDYYDSFDEESEESNEIETDPKEYYDSYDEEPDDEDETGPNKTDTLVPLTHIPKVATTSNMHRKNKKKRKRRRRRKTKECQQNRNNQEIVLAHWNARSLLPKEEILKQTLIQNNVLSCGICETMLYKDASLTDDYWKWEPGKENCPKPNHSHPTRGMGMFFAKGKGRHTILHVSDDLMAARIEFSKNQYPIFVIESHFPHSQNLPAHKALWTRITTLVEDYIQQGHVVMLADCNAHTKANSDHRTDEAGQLLMDMASKRSGSYGSQPHRPLRG